MKRIFTILACILLITTATAQTDRTPAGNAENVVKVVRFYPNPASSFINFEFKETRLADFSFKVFNFIGKKVLEIIQMAAKDARRQLRQVTFQTQSSDHPIIWGWENTHYLKFLIVQVL